MSLLAVPDLHAFKCIVDPFVFFCEWKLNRGHEHDCLCELRSIQLPDWPPCIKRKALLGENLKAPYS